MNVERIKPYLVLSLIAAIILGIPAAITYLSFQGGPSIFHVRCVGTDGTVFEDYSRGEVEELPRGLFAQGLQGIRFTNLEHEQHQLLNVSCQISRVELEFVDNEWRVP